MIYESSDRYSLSPDFPPGVWLWQRLWRVNSAYLYHITVADSAGRRLQFWLEISNCAFCGSVDALLNSLLRYVPFAANACTFEMDSFAVGGQSFLDSVPVCEDAPAVTAL